MALDTVNALITVAEFKDYLGQSTGSTSYENRYADLINTASYRFNSVTDRKLKARATTELRDGTGLNYIHTNEWPINNTAATIDIRVDTDREFTTGDKVDSTSIVIYSTYGEIKLDGDIFSQGMQSVKLVYNAGYATIPFDLQYACKEYCHVLWSREQTNHVAVKSESVEGSNVTYEPDMPLTVRRILESYKRADISEEAAY